MKEQLSIMANMHTIMTHTHTHIANDTVNNIIDSVRITNKFHAKL